MVHRNRARRAEIARVGHSALRMTDGPGRAQRSKYCHDSNAPMDMTRAVAAMDPISSGRRV